MGLVNQTIPGLYNGVSQQPDELRLDTQVSEMINCYPSIVEGVQKRPPASPVATDAADNNNISMTDDVFIHAYDRGEGIEKYIIVIQNDAGKGYWRTYDATTGSPVGAMDWEEHDYLVVPADATVAASFALVTVGDTTYVVNKTKEVEMAPIITESTTNTYTEYDVSKYVVTGTVSDNASTDCDEYANSGTSIVAGTIKVKLVTPLTGQTSIVDFTHGTGSSWAAQSASVVTLTAPTVGTDIYFANIAMPKAATHYTATITITNYAGSGHVGLAMAGGPPSTLRRQDNGVITDTFTTTQNEGDMQAFQVFADPTITAVTITLEITALSMSVFETIILSESADGIDTE